MRTLFFDARLASIFFWLAADQGRGSACSAVRW